MDLTFIQKLQLFAANNTIMVVAWVALFVAVLFSFYKAATNKHKVIGNHEATLLINNQEGIIVDIRSDDEFKSGHIIDSLHAFPTDIKTEKATFLSKYKDRPVIVADNNGLLAAGCANALVKQGFSDVYVLKEGIAGWRAANLPTVKKHK
ncbi:rhodanese-related sulfurtransferase [Nicoletella semolina]|uniref:Rhodanese-related sulfurtransferase n=1 Tax=Nicoletella semolina TaxID=271160 RepID=A0A4V2SJT1_9PAST|nr:rhodanese-like domain-containing protein [Nicoletella semolina]MDH2924404.1 rhodanese-like domain-containing protein [Nicoletella semolina]TCP16816.1 rhodanese-related sulfurtransferase [Nicoletella semolina]